MNYLIIILSLLFFSGCSKDTTTDVPSQGNSTYYLNSRTGDDNQDGLSPATAWRTLVRAGKNIYKEGDKLLLKRGETFTGSLLLNAHGTKDNPVVVSAWPENDTVSPLPLLEARGYLTGIQAVNPDHLIISDLEIISDAGEPREYSAREKRYGIMLLATRGHISRDITLRDLSIHQIFSTENVPADGQNPTSNMGMGIYISSDNTSSFRDILIEGCHIERTGHTAIKIRSAAGRDTSLYVHDLKILNNYLKDIGGPGIQPGKCINVLVKGNITDHTGSLIDPRMHGRGSGIWPWYCRNVLIEHNRFMYAHGKMDSRGAHIDHHCRDVVIQYNMSIENGGGFVEILGDNHNCSYRYNISVNDGWRRKGEDGAVRDGEILFFSNYTGQNVEKKGPYNSYIYNNTIYVREEILTGFFLANTTAGLMVANNIFYIPGETHTTVRNGTIVPGAKPQNIFFINNLYLHAGTLPEDFPVKDSLPLYGDPVFASPGGYAPENYIPTNTALIKDKGITIPRLPGENSGLKTGLNVKMDILGNDISGKPDLGAIEIKQP
jgi:hypothetical protein